MIFLLNALAAQSFYFKKYQVERGLSHNSVWCLLQDSYGFMWFGTSDGLNRFDGKKFKVFRKDNQDKFSLGNNSVQALFEDKQKNIWVGTTEGIYIYKRTNGQFLPFNKKTQYNVSISSEVKKIIQTSKGQVWIATLGQGIFVYDTQTGILTQNSLHTSFVWDMSQDATYRIYSSSLQEGLICYDQNGKYLNSFIPTPGKKDVGNLRISCIQTVDDQVWFSVGTNALCSLDSKTKQVKQFTGGNEHIGTIKAIAKYSEKELLIGSDKGLYIFRIAEGEFVRIDNPLDPRSLSDQSISGILKDKEGGFWVSTYLGGVNYLPRQTIVFNYYPPTFDPRLCTGKVITQFCENTDGNIWVGAQDGLKLLDVNTREAAPFPIPGITQTLDIRALLLDEGNLWIGTYANGLKVLNLSKRKLTEYFHIRNSSKTICSNDVLSLYRDKKKNIYVGTTWGLCRYNRLTDDFEILNFVGSMTSVFDILEDRAGYLWIATDNVGVFRFNPANNQWKHYVREEDHRGSITSNSIITLHEDLNGRVWFGTNGGGLCYFDEKTESFIDFDPKNQFLSSKVIYSIEEDILGNFWISGNAGLLRVNPTNKNNLKLFTQEDGLQSNQFNFRASLKSSTDMLYFGGINGFNSFFPNDFVENSYVPPVYIVDVKLYNSSEKESEKLLNLEMPVFESKEIVLPYVNNSIAFEFSALSFVQPDKNKYKYMLDGFDKQWIDNAQINMALYSNLPAGEYVFRVKGTNNDHKWNEKEASIRLVILPPWWGSVYAYWGYFIVLIVAGYKLYRYLAAKTRRKFARKLEDYQVKTEKEAYQSKINFFVNLVHEIRTPLSLIKLPLERLSEKHSDNEATGYLSAINKNVNYLLHVAGQLLDFQKIENQGIVLDIRNHSINDLVSEVYQQFVFSAASLHIDMSLSLPDDDRIIAFDRDKVYKILINLLSNALKHAKGRIDVQVDLFDDRFEIRIADDGAGIPDKEKAKVFEPFYQSAGAKSTLGTGIGLAFSKSLAESHNGHIQLVDNEWKGASFILSIPVQYGKLAVSSVSEKVQVAAAAEVIDDQVREEPQAIDAPFRKYKVLLVEDNTELLNMIEDSLKSYFTIYKARNGRSGLDILYSEIIDLVVSDVMMPEMDGLELCKAVKSDINYSHIPVILLTAKTGLGSRIEGMDYGADVYLEKPFSIKYLRKQISNLLQLKVSFQNLLATNPSQAIESIPVSHRDKEFLERLHEKIEEHIAELDFSIDGVAETMFLSRSSFYRKIKSITGVSPGDYLKMQRLNKAAEMLLQGEYPISEICARTAFSSSSYFAKCFKAQFGVLPKDYSEKIKESQ
jgi:signal transduction histidine kinase/ligand-binding sensor domain-containing protein/DNA-binding response OmpR family regulator